MPTRNQMIDVLINATGTSTRAQTNTSTHRHTNNLQSFLSSALLFCPSLTSDPEYDSGSFRCSTASVPCQQNMSCLFYNTANSDTLFSSPLTASNVSLKAFTFEAIWFLNTVLFHFVCSPPSATSGKMSEELCSFILNSNILLELLFKRLAK